MDTEAALGLLGGDYDPLFEETDGAVLDGAPVVEGVLENPQEHTYTSFIMSKTVEALYARKDIWTGATVPSVASPWQGVLSGGRTGEVNDEGIYPLLVAVAPYPSALEGAVEFTGSWPYTDYAQAEVHLSVSEPCTMGILINGALAHSFEVNEADVPVTEVANFPSTVQTVTKVALVLLSEPAEAFLLKFGRFSVRKNLKDIPAPTLRR